MNGARVLSRLQALLHFHLFLLWIPTHGRKSDYTQEEIQILLNVHNYYRRKVDPPAANMQKLEWHSELASMAQDWADKCTFEHGQPKRDRQPFEDIGQNLNKFTSSNLKRLDSLEARTHIPLRTWWDEVTWYDFASDRCLGPMCGHYTQLVWARTKYVGCGYLNGTQCPGKFTYVVCNYGPTGNIGLNPKQPYIRGDPCSKCDSGHGWCDDKLCITCTDQTCACPLKCKNCGIFNAKNCTCTCTEGWDYADCSEPCENSNKTVCTRMHQASCSLIQPEWCRAKCGHCTSSRNTTKAMKCCGGKQCRNKGYLNTGNCECMCPGGFHDKSCELADGHRLITTLSMILPMVSLVMASSIGIS
ncbi:cysteine-rich secretory protein 3 isoform X2 [Microcaecilia unicolor]|uniref:Cysteine-rich secretory protein 3-like isoform X2 n=1 Tax=Microcaecilia unicolor TaxID=1415580 RepID=A0A6P7YB68_9AMPH|nr:cysteine-rich secretory protein 3-like isoform X2 [Microcaecilia unicolor]